MYLLRKLTVIVIATLLLTACGGKDKESDDKKKPETVEADRGPAGKLEGAWEIKRAEGDMTSLNEGTVYEFKGDKLSFGKGGFVNPGKTEVTDSTFSFQADGNELKFMYDYHLNGDTLVVTMQGGSDQIFHMVKK